MYKVNFANFRKLVAILASLFLITWLSACSGGNDDGNGVGYIQLYNTSANSPEIIMLVGKDDDEDYEEQRLSGVGYPSTGGQLDFATATYDIDFTWQNDDNIDDLEVLQELSTTIFDAEIKFIVFSGDVNTPDISTFDIPIIDDADDADNEVFNIRFLNMHSVEGGVDIYISQSDETFEEAILLGNFSYDDLSENQKIEQNDYVFYLTLAGSNNVVYQSDTISFNNTNQFVMAVRKNSGAGDSPFTLDLVSNTIEEFPDSTAQAKIRIYNGIPENELLSGYQGDFNFYLDGIDDTAEISGLSIKQYSDSMLTSFGDHGLGLTIPTTDEVLIENHLLTLEANSDKTIFFYALIEPVDADNDGNVDEDGDGFVDSYQLTATPLVVENSQSESIYNHQIKIINLIDNFDALEVFFVKSDETTETTSNAVYAIYGQPSSITLTNNSYTLFVIGQDGSSQEILATETLSLNQDSKELFLVLEENENSNSGYTASFNSQRD